MKQVRFLVSGLAVAALTVGYVGSQVYWFEGRAAEWAGLVDVPVVAWLALAFLGIGILLWVIPDREAS